MWLIFTIGLVIGLIIGTWLKRQGIRERDEEIKRLKNLVKDLQYYYNRDK